MTTTTETIQSVKDAKQHYDKAKQHLHDAIAVMLQNRTHHTIRALSEKTGIPTTTLWRHIRATGTRRNQLGGDQ